MAISVDVRVDRVSDIPTSIVTDWPIAATLNQLQGETDLAVVPTMGVYVAGITESWYGFMVGTAGADYNPDLGTGVALGTWYRVEQRLHTVTGAFEVKISNLETGQVLLDSMDVVPAWTPEDGLFDVVAFFDGEISLSTVSNLAVMDNIWVSDDAVAAAVHAVRSDVDLLLAAGLISERLASSAGGRLDTAWVKLGQGDTNAASGNLGAAIHMIEAVIGRDIDQADADPIIAALQAVVDSL